MAITQTGSILDFAPASTANTGTVSSTITVPADAEVVVVGVTGYDGNANPFTGGQMTFTQGGADTIMSEGSNLGNADTSFFMAAMFYLTLPDTGSNKSLKWDWAGAAAIAEAPIFSVTFWKGIDTASPVRSTSGDQSGNPPYTTATLTAQSGDLIVAWAGWFAGGSEGTATTWSNLTELAEVAFAANADGAWATSSPSGDTTVGLTAQSIGTDGGIVAIVFKAAAEGGGAAPDFGYGPTPPAGPIFSYRNRIIGVQPQLGVN